VWWWWIGGRAWCRLPPSDRGAQGLHRQLVADIRRPVGVQPVGGGLDDGSGGT
jgi:hypothetical protein